MESLYLDEIGAGAWFRSLFVPPPGYDWDLWIGNWVAAILTLALFSFLWSDNTIFKLAEHVFVGSATGYLIIRAFWDSIYNKLGSPFFNPPVGGERDWWLLIPMILGAMTLMRLIPAVSWGTRWPLAFFAGVGIGLSVIGYMQANIVEQVEDTIDDFRHVSRFHQDYELEIRTPEESALLTQAMKQYQETPGCDRPKYLPTLGIFIAPVVKDREWIPAESVLTHVIASGVPAAGDKIVVRHRDWGQLINSLLMAIGVFTGLIYFFFSVEHRGIFFGGCSRIGIWFLMVSFGASFGFTVMARISLLIGRLQFLFGDWLHLQSTLSSIPR